jgi:hypothetical protein
MAGGYFDSSTLTFLAGSCLTSSDEVWFILRLFNFRSNHSRDIWLERSEAWGTHVWV